MSERRERRAAERIAPPRTLRAKVKSVMPARVLDISPHGLQIEIAAHLRPESDCELRLNMDQGEVVLRAWVRRCRAWGFGLDDADRKVLLYRAGLEFVGVDSESLARFREALFPFPTAKAPAVVAGPLEVAPEVEEETEETGGLFEVAPASAGQQTPDLAAGRVRIRISSRQIQRILRGEEE